jgi:hypothetical protein
MPFAYADYLSVDISNVQAVSTDDEEINEEGAYVIPVIVPASQVAELLANYTPTSGTSPSVTYSRPLARTILDALKKKSEE